MTGALKAILVENRRVWVKDESAEWVRREQDEREKGSCKREIGGRMRVINSSMIKRLFP